MSKRLAFWILIFLWVIFSVWWWWPDTRIVGYRGYMPLGGSLLEFALFVLLGWAVFGKPIE